MESRRRIVGAWASGIGLGLLLAVSCAPASEDAPPPAAEPSLSPDRIAAVRDYIKRTWTTLTRSHQDLLQAAPDPKVERGEGEPWLLYVSQKEDLDKIRQELTSVLSAEDAQHLDIRRLPTSGEIEVQGLLYLPRPYVVPGGRFNEMYGWDSYFIQVGLLLDGELELARDMAENFLYEIEHYGTILNANRTYYLTRSQPPFLTQMLLGVYEKTQDQEWLRAALPAIEKYYQFWTTPPHLTEQTGLSRYYDSGEGPAPEVIADERDSEGRTHYDRVRAFYRENPVTDYPLDRFYDAEKDQLTPLFYKGDRSMRESGFDPSNRFGPFNVGIVFYNPVCLNSLLYAMEQQASQIEEILGNAEKAKIWKARASRRRDAVNAYLWDETSGLYLDYNFETGERRRYEYASTFYPLWVGLANPEQARRVRENLSRFEAPGGLLTSTRETGNQWDAPFGWAPLQMIAVQGLQRYGYGEEANRLAHKFLALVTKEFEEHGVIVEKYDVVRRESDVSSGIRYGYSSNEVGFGWTNAAYLALLGE